MKVHCPKCPKKAKTNEALSSHTSLYHSSAYTIYMPKQDGSVEEVAITRTPLGKVHCPVCDKGYACAVSLQAHVKISCFGDEQTKKCPYCSKAFRHLQFYNSHVEAKICIVANEWTRLRAASKYIPRGRKGSRTTQMAKAKIRVALNNESSSKSSNVTRSAKKPCKKGPPFRIFKCFFCKEGFKRRNQLQQHFEEECFEPPFGDQEGRLTCFGCSRCFEYKRDLKLHIHNYHQDTITVRVNSEDHIVARNEYDKFGCPQCHLSFNFPSYLEAHAYYFCGEISIECPECESPFESILQLNTHINSMHMISLPTPLQPSTPGLLSPMSSTIISPSTSSLDDPIPQKKPKQLRFSLTSFESDQDTCVPKTDSSLKRKTQHLVYRKLKHVKVEI